MDREEGSGQRTIDMMRAMFPAPCVVVPGASWEPGDRRFVGHPVGREPRLLVPQAPISVSRSALHAYKPGGGSGIQLRRNAVDLAINLGLLRLQPPFISIRGDRSAPSLLSQLSKLLGTEVVCAVHFGPPRANRKPVLHLMRPNGRTVAFAKVGTNDHTRRRVSVEARALEQLQPLASASLRLPQVLHTGEWRDLGFLVLAPLDITDSRADPSTRDKALQEIVAGFPIRRTQLAQSSWWAGLTSALGDHAAPEAALLRSTAKRLAEEHGRTSLLFGAQHGDWSPWNLSTSRTGTTVWDWERFSLDRPLGLDALNYRFRDMIRRPKVGATTACERTVEEAPELARANHGSVEHAGLLGALFLLDLGVRYLQQSLEGGVARFGNLADWLWPILTQVVDDLH